MFPLYILRELTQSSSPFRRTPSWLPPLDFLPILILVRSPTHSGFPNLPERPSFLSCTFLSETRVSGWVLEEPGWVIVQSPKRSSTVEGPTRRWRDNSSWVRSSPSGLGLRRYCGRSGEIGCSEVMTEEKDFTLTFPVRPFGIRWIALYFCPKSLIY